MLRNFFKKIAQVARKMQSEVTPANNAAPLSAIERLSNLKRPVDTQDSDTVVKISKRIPYRKKKVAMLIAYNGANYQGLQINPGAKTIEADVLTALLKAGLIMPEAVTNPGVQISFQRAARTDKGVSAAGQLLSLKVFVDIEDPITKVNEHLVDAIRVIGMKRVTQGFNSKNRCDARTYQYLMPTYAFTPCTEIVNDKFRISDEIKEKLKRTLKRYCGTHNYHNFTSGKKHGEDSSKRYIISFQMDEPFVKDGVEFVLLTVKGQSFMIHQIRKMVGFAIAIVRGLSSDEALNKAWQPDRVDVPIAPSLGLLLDRLHYDAYNKQFGNDGMHCSIQWEAEQETIDQFKFDKILSVIMDTEVKEKSMMNWMQSLALHTFDNVNTFSGTREAFNLLREQRRHKAVEIKSPNSQDNSTALEKTTDEDVKPAEEVTTTRVKDEINVETKEVGEKCSGDEVIQAKDEEVVLDNKSINKNQVEDLSLPKKDENIEVKSNVN